MILPLFGFENLISFLECLRISICVYGFNYSGFCSSNQDHLNKKIVWIFKISTKVFRVELTAIVSFRSVIRCRTPAYDNMIYCAGIHSSTVKKFINILPNNLPKFVFILQKQARIQGLYVPPFIDFIRIKLHVSGNINATFEVITLTRTYVYIINVDLALTAPVMSGRIIYSCVRI